MDTTTWFVVLAVDLVFLLVRFARCVPYASRVCEKERPSSCSTLLFSRSDFCAHVFVGVLVLSI